MSNIANLLAFTDATVLVTRASVVIHYHSGRGSAGSLRTSLPGPAIQAVVCAEATGEDDVARCIGEVERVCSGRRLSLLVNNTAFTLPRSSSTSPPGKRS